MIAGKAALVTYKRWTRLNVSSGETAELALVDELAANLDQHIQDASEDLKALHVHGAPSKAIQDRLGSLLRDELRFDEEVVLTPQDGLVTRARPDFFFRINESRDILAEVERGGATTNNHDLKDLWKAHVAPDAHHLFLIVPNNNWRADGTARERPFPLVARRLGAFFGDPRREIDVLSVHVFGH